MKKLQQMVCIPWDEKAPDKTIEVYIQIKKKIEWKFYKKMKYCFTAIWTCTEVQKNYAQVWLFFLFPRLGIEVINSGSVIASSFTITKWLNWILPLVEVVFHSCS